jgi:hypothetical protein
MAELRETGSADAADIAQTENADIHCSFSFICSFSEIGNPGKTLLHIISQFFSHSNSK